MLFSHADSHVYNSSFIQMILSLTTFFIDFFFSPKKGMEIDKHCILKLGNTSLGKKKEKQSNSCYLLLYPIHFTILRFGTTLKVFLVVQASLSLTMSYRAYRNGLEKYQLLTLTYLLKQQQRSKHAMNRKLRSLYTVSIYIQEWQIEQI